MLNASKVVVQGWRSAYKEPLNCILWDSLYIAWNEDGTYELQFTAYDDNSVAYSMLYGAEASIFFDGQEYISKQPIPNFAEGIDTIQVTATHVSHSISRIRQYNTRSGTLTYQPRDVLAYYLDGNSLGFTYDVQGSFTSQEIQDLGNSSASDMLSKILDTWPDAIIYPDNKKIVVYSQDKWERDLGNRIDYLHNTREIQLTYDSNSLVNKVKAIGAEIEDDNADSDVDAAPKYYFAPHFVVDQSSIDTWGERPGDDVQDDRFKYASAMDAYVKTQLVPEPPLSIEVTLEGNEKPIAGEIRRLEIRRTNFVTNVRVVGFTWYPNSKVSDTTITLNNNAKNILDYRNSANQALSKAVLSMKNSYKNSNTTNNVSTLFTWSSEEMNDFGSN
ncbi:phage tail protein [Paucilactobacillus sp. N302-9]